MATIATLVGRQSLFKIEAVLGPNEGCPIREIYGVPDVRHWIANVLPQLPTEAGTSRSPMEEFDDLLFNFISSEGRLRYGKMFKDLIPASEELWELKTWQLRIFGWFYRKDCFIAVHPDQTVRVKGKSEGYRNAINKVKQVRMAIDLDEPKYVGGVITNVVSL
jgi:hypothetical protein